VSFDHSRQFIGASECGAIAGLDSFKAKISIWDRLVNGTAGEDSTLAERGRVFEPALLEHYRNKTGHKLIAPVKTRLLEGKPFIGATPDGLDQEEPLAVEAKAPHFRTHEKWDNDNIPPKHVVQVQIQCAVFKLPSARIVVDLGDRIEIRPVDFDTELAGYIIEQVERFHRDHVVTKKAPDPDGSDSYSEWLARRFPGAQRDMRDATDEEVRLALELQAARDKADAADAEAKRIRQELEARIGEHRGIRGSFGSILWSDTKGRESLDSKALKAAHPDIAAKFVKQGAPFRTFKATFKESA
jgi:putative phage-type endonuclease